VTVIGRSLTWADIDATAAYAHAPRAAEWLQTRADRIALVVWPDATTTLIDRRGSKQSEPGQPRPKAGARR
jgi:thiamine biosynthesis lipoprotein